MRLFARLFLLACLLLPTGHHAVGQINSTTKVEVSAVPQRSEASPGDQFAIAIILDHAKGWHTQTNDPKLPESLKDLALIATEVRVESPPKFAKFGPIQWPKPELVKVGFLGDPVEMEFFTGKSVIYIPVQLSADAPNGDLTLTLAVTIQACDDKQCLAPADVPLEVRIAIKPAAQLTSAPSDSASLFTAFDPSVYSRMNSSDGGGASPAARSRFDFFGYQFSLAQDQFALIFLIALAAGFLLNLTPCVLPVIPIKILSLQQQAGNPTRLALFGSVYCVGIVATFLVLGLVIFGVVTGGQKQDWGQVFTSRWFTIAMASIVGVMGLGMIGLFTIRLPQSVYMLNPSHDTIAGNFLLGVLTAILSTPCTGPLLGATIAWAATRPAWLGLVTFVVMGIGMALPYAILIAFPRLIDRLPKAGPGGELLKQVLGVLMFAVAIFLLSNLTSEKWPWFAVGAVSALAGLWAIVGAWRMLRSSTAKGFVTLFGIVWIAGSAFAARALTSEGPVAWRVFANQPETKIRADIDAALAAHKTVVIDFTAKWCTNCHVLERTVLLSDTGVRLLNAPDVLPLKVDLTSAGQEQGWGLVREISGGGGIPLIAIFRPGQAKPAYFNSFFKPSDLEAAIKGPISPS